MTDRSQTADCRVFDCKITYFSAEREILGFVEGVREYEVVAVVSECRR